MTLNQCHHTKEVDLEVYSNDLRDYTATHHANAWYIMGVATTDITTWVVATIAKTSRQL
jgi:predicted branched-subunit amino acid permease